VRRSAAPSLSCLTVRDGATPTSELRCGDGLSRNIVARAAAHRVETLVVAGDDHVVPAGAVELVRAAVTNEVVVVRAGRALCL
jgi:hypothetical protein